MKRTMLAILAISPVMLHAQVKSSAQPESTPVLQSSNIQPAALAGLKSVDSAVAAPTPARVSSGITPPKLIHSVEVDHNHVLTFAGDRTVTIGLTVDANGNPSNIRVIKAADMFTDSGIVSAVDQYRYKPATLNGTAVPMGLTLDFTIQQ